MSLLTKNTSILTVTQITKAIKQELEESFSSISIQGEISNFRRQSSGHFYFSLKDEHAQISAVMFRGNTISLKKIPKNGDQVIVKGEISVYPPHGKYQLLIHELEYAGLGELLLKLEKLKRKIHQLGWFAKEHKKSLPKSPKKIGVITSPTGAVIQDILNILTRRFSTFHLILNPVRVQGKGSALEIAQAIEQFNQYNLVDVIILGRGGGSIEDLWAFNEEVVAKAIFHSKTPIIAAVGHQTDHTIAEYVADVRAPTPSAAAEIVIAEKTQQLQAFNQIHQRLSQASIHLIKQRREKLNGIAKQTVLVSPYTLLGRHIQQLDDIRNALDYTINLRLQHFQLSLKGKKEQASSLKPTRLIQNYLKKIKSLNKILNTSLKQHLASANKTLMQINKNVSEAWQRNFSFQDERFKALARNIQAIDPQKLLRKGYSIAFSEKDCSVIVSAKKVKIKDRIRIKLSEGEIIAEIKNVIK